MATENKNLSAYKKDEIPNASKLRFGIVVSEWNEEITEGLYSGAVEALVDCGAKKENILRWNVPGSFELTFGVVLDNLFDSDFFGFLSKESLA